LCFEVNNDTKSIPICGDTITYVWLHGGFPGNSIPFNCPKMLSSWLSST
jgi:hypothetical protein